MSRPKAPLVAIALGSLIALVHLVLGLTSVMSPSQWISGVVIGALIAGAGNHRRIFGRR
jgi:hypothetical protein